MTSVDGRDVGNLGEEVESIVDILCYLIEGDSDDDAASRRDSTVSVTLQHRIELAFIMSKSASENIFDLPPEEAEMPFSILDTDLYKVGLGWRAELTSS